ncbi:hypothetical protein ACFX4N_24480 [Priestia sp. YIM B13551]|uniref:hypothetical protein n=1 Tax=Priestia sp. YIM B13551 TaxID=3366306 RepID=UPI00366E74EC
MTNYTNEYPEQNVHVFIGNEEWATFSFENKVRLLYRLRQCETLLARELEKTISLLVEEEQKEREIDYEATLKRAEEDVSEWPE